MSIGNFEYTLDEIEKFGFTELHQVFLFGSTVKEMRKQNPKGKVHTWMGLEWIAEKFGV